MDLELSNVTSSVVVGNVYNPGVPIGAPRTEIPVSVSENFTLFPDERRFFLMPACKALIKHTNENWHDLCVAVYN